MKVLDLLVPVIMLAVIAVLVMCLIITFSGCYATNAGFGAGLAVPLSSPPPTITPLPEGHP